MYVVAVFADFLAGMAVRGATAEIRQPYYDTGYYRDSPDTAVPFFPFIFVYRLNNYFVWNTVVLRKCETNLSRVH
jgi:hypothetical protein